MFLRDLIDTTNVYLKMMEKYCQGSIVVQSRSKKKKANKKPKKVLKEPKVAKKKLKREEIMVSSKNLDL
jgi:timeless